MQYSYYKMITDFSEVKMFNFIFMADANYFMPMSVAIYSLIKNKKEQSEYKIYVLLDGVEKGLEEKLYFYESRTVKIIIQQIDNQLIAGLPNKSELSVSHVSKTDMIKFLLPQILQTVDKALYLDDDLIVNRNIEELFSVNIDNYYLAAAKDMGDSIYEGRSFLASRIGIDKAEYFNAGVMFLNLKKMRQDGISEKLIEYRKNGLNYFMSQDAMNYVTREKRIIISNTYNFMTSVLKEYSLEEINERFCNHTYLTIDECLSNQIVLHMAGKRKPWEYYIPWLTEIYKNNLSRSIFSDTPLLLKMEPKENSFEEFIWHVFILNVNKDERIILYGAGKRGRYLYKKNKEENYCKIVKWLDRVKYDDLDDIYNPNDINNEEYTKMVVAISSVELVKEIKKELAAQNVDMHKVIVIG